MIGNLSMLSLAAAATALMRSIGPTRIGAMRPAFAASTTPCSELSSHGCATAVGVGGKALQRSSNASYLLCFLSIVRLFRKSFRYDGNGGQPAFLCLTAASLRLPDGRLSLSTLRMR